VQGSKPIVSFESRQAWRAASADYNANSEQSGCWVVRPTMVSNLFWDNLLDCFNVYTKLCKNKSAILIARCCLFKATIMIHNTLYNWIGFFFSTKCNMACDCRIMDKIKYIVGIYGYKHRPKGVVTVLLKCVTWINFYMVCLKMQSFLFYFTEWMCVCFFFIL
jgi:hypothetical protein